MLIIVNYNRIIIVGVDSTLDIIFYSSQSNLNSSLILCMIGKFMILACTIKSQCILVCYRYIECGPIFVMWRWFAPTIFVIHPNDVKVNILGSDIACLSLTLHLAINTIRFIAIN